MHGSEDAKGQTGILIVVTPSAHPHFWLCASHYVPVCVFLHVCVSVCTHVYSCLHAPLLTQRVLSTLQATCCGGKFLV